MNSTRSRFQSIGLTLGAAGFALGMTAAAQAAVVISTADGNGADTYLTNDDQQGPTTANGTGTSMTLFYNGASRAKILYFRFDISNVTGDLSGATITLNSTGNNRTRTHDIYALADNPTQGGAGNNWDEATTSWSTASGVDTGAALNVVALNSDFTSVATLGYTQNVPGDYTSTTGTLANFLAADTDGLVTFAFARVAPDGNDLSFFQTKEAGNDLQPRLNLPNASLVPEPASLALLGLGGLLMVNRRRARVC